jgi:hypothetical protein
MPTATIPETAPAIEHAAAEVAFWAVFGIAEVSHA